MADYAQIAMNIGGGIYTAILIILGLTIAGLITWAIIMYFKNNIKIRIREVVKGRTQIIDTKGRIVKDKKGIRWLKIVKPKEKITEPPSNAIEINEKGKKVIEIYKTEDGSFIYITDKFDYNKILGDSYKGEMLEPFTTQQRALLINEYKEAESYKKRSLGETILAIFPYLAVIMIITVFLIFFGSAAQPILEVGDKYVVATEKLERVATTLENVIIERQQMLLDNSNSSLIYSNQTAPN